MLRRSVPAPRLTRALMVGLVLALALFAAEDAIHSVHHLLAEPAEVAACTFATASAHLAGTAVELVSAEPPLLPRLELAAALKPPAPPLQPLRRDQDRAPPRAV